MVTMAILSGTPYNIIVVGKTVDSIVENLPQVLDRLLAAGLKSKS